MIVHDCIHDRLLKVVEGNGKVDKGLVVHFDHRVLLDLLQSDKKAGTGVRSVSCPSCECVSGASGGVCN